MASIRKHNKGWRAEIARQGVRRSKVLPTRREAQDWAARAEYEALNAPAIAASTLFRDVLHRYAREVSPSKRGERWEVLRSNKIAAQPIGAIQMRKLGPGDFADWRDARLKQVAPGTVSREMAYLSAVLSIARREWGLISENPMAGVRKPREPEARNRLATIDELARLAVVAGDDLSRASARAFLAFRFACETGMRAGEIVGLEWERVDLDRRVASLTMTKNETSRDVPLSLAAVAMLRSMPGTDPVFGLNSSQMDALWRRVRDRAGVVGLTFHDSRYHAITNLSRKLDVLALAKMIGHRNISQLMTYYDAPAEDLARRLD